MELTIELVYKADITILGPGTTWPERGNLYKVNISYKKDGIEFVCPFMEKSVYDMWKELQVLKTTVDKKIIKRLIENFNEYGHAKYIEASDNCAIED